MSHPPHPPRSDALVMFGLTGDLGRKKLLPALYELAAAGRLGIPVVGVGRSDHSDDELREMFRDAVSDHAPAGGGDIDADVVASVDLAYHRGDSAEAATYDELADRLDGAAHPLVYAALPPHLFGDVADGLASSRLADTTRLVVEKPFGHDASSARSLWERVTAAVPAEQVFIVDHFLAKAAIENISVVRTVNPIIANSMCADHVAAVDIVMHESGGVDGRGSFYDGVGALRDVVQNHLMELLALLMMEPPQDGSDESYHAARVAVLELVRPIRPDDVVLGQYDGYRDLDGVADDSDVETYASLVLELDHDRWRGVPITIRTGKRMSEDRTEAIVHLRPGSHRSTEHGNRIRFVVKPNPALAIDLDVVDPETHRSRPTTVYACGPADHGELGDYAVMFDNAMSGESRHFAHIDGVVAAWDALAPVLAADLPVHPYRPGTHGPDVTPLA